MNTYQRISMELKNYFGEHSLLKLLLPLDKFFVFGSVGIMVLGMFVNVGVFLSSVAYYCFFLGLILAYANLHNKFVYSGLFIYAALNAYQVIRSSFMVIRYIFQSIRYGFFSFDYIFFDFHSFFTLIIFGYLGYLVYRQEIKNSLNINQSGGV